jgi:hypothetical protein
MVLPKRNKDRTLKPLPKKEKSITEIEEPAREIPTRLKPDPNLEKACTDNEEP